MPSSRVYPSLERAPGNKDNWVERAGGLPSYIERIAKHLHYEKGMPIGRSIAVAVNACKRMCATGDLNFKGKQSVNPKSRAQACKAIAEWNAKRMKARVQKGEILKLDDRDFVELMKYLEDDEFTLTAEISKVDDDQMLAFGWASVGIEKGGSIVDDHQGDVLDTPEEIEKAAYRYVLESRDGGEMHIRKGVATLVESFASTPEKWEAMGIPEGTLPVGWWVGYKVHDPEVWKGIKDGRYRMLSVHGRGNREPI